MGFFDSIGGRKITVEKAQKVIQITNNGKQALAGGGVKGVAFDILSTMSNSYPYTIEDLAERVKMRESMVRHECNALLDLKYITIIN
jgi:hypothetical protein